ncbi:hypothetical protein II810_05105 [bacterium]|nr:hypothetical protein [bacterium]
MITKVGFNTGKNYTNFDWKNSTHSNKNNPNQSNINKKEINWSYYIPFTREKINPRINWKA